MSEEDGVLNGGPYRRRLAADPEERRLQLRAVQALLELHARITRLQGDETGARALEQKAEELLAPR